jgi:hypothetical protein
MIKASPFSDKFVQSLICVSFQLFCAPTQQARRVKMDNHHDFGGIRSDSVFELMDRSMCICSQGGTRLSVEAETGFSHPTRNKQTRGESKPSKNAFAEQAPLLTEDLDEERGNSVSNEEAFIPENGSQFRAMSSITSPFSREANIHSHLNDTSTPHMSSASKPHITNVRVKLVTERQPTQKPTITSAYSNTLSSLSESEQVPDGESDTSHKAGVTDAGDFAHNLNSLTRTLCIIGLICTFFISIPLVAGGSYLLHWAFVNKVNVDGSGEVSGATVGGSLLLNHFIPLSLNIGITLLTEPLGLIHATTLRWALYSEGRLQFNTNLRLFTSSRRITANTWAFNTLNTVFLVASYASTSLVLIGEPSEAMVEEDWANLEATPD